ncbi:MAG: adenosylcobinamide-GDP ribazoletransferase, partial [Turicibacter sp.]
MKNLYVALNMAISMFTIIPLPKYEWEESAAKHMMKFYPLIGLIIGGLWYASAQILQNINASHVLTSAILLAIPYLLTGFLHLDGFMDVSDALLSRRPKEDKLRILKDSRVGAFSVIALALLFIVEFAALDTIIIENQTRGFLILIPIISRSIVGYLLITREAISESYLGKLFKTGTGLLDQLILCAVFLLMCFLGGFI